MERFAEHGFGDAKVDDFDEVVAPTEGDQDDVVGFEIAVNDAFAVCSLHGVADLGKDFEAPIQGQGRVGCAEVVCERESAQVFHDIEVTEVRNFTKVIKDADDVGVVLREDRRKLHFAKEARFHAGFVDEFWFEYLDHTIRIAFDEGVLRTIDRAKPSFSQDIDQSVFSSDLKERKVTMDAEAQRSCRIVIGIQIHLAVGAMRGWGVRHRRGEPRSERMVFHAERYGLRARLWLFRSDATALSRVRPSCGSRVFPSGRPSVRSRQTTQTRSSVLYLRIDRGRLV